MNHDHLHHLSHHACVQDDEAVLQKLEAALAAGPDPELDALTKVIDNVLRGRQAWQLGRRLAWASG
jgi:hypothetical protein